MYKKINKFQSLISSLLFFIVFVLFASITEFKITEIQLSYYGAYTEYNIIKILG